MQTDIETHITEKIICEDCNPGFVADIVMPFGIRDANNTIDQGWLKEGVFLKPPPRIENS